MADSINEFFSEIAKGVDPEKIEDMNATFQWDITGDGGGKWFAEVAGGTIEINAGESTNPDLTITVSASDWLNIVNGKLNPQMAFVVGKVKIDGDMTLAAKLQYLIG
jgi:putative sterol carrier protein